MSLPAGSVCAEGKQISLIGPIGPIRLSAPRLSTYPASCWSIGLLAPNS